MRQLGWVLVKDGEVSRGGGGWEGPYRGVRRFWIPRGIQDWKVKIWRSSRGLFYRLRAFRARFRGVRHREAYSRE